MYLSFNLRKQVNKTDTETNKTPGKEKAEMIICPYWHL